MTHLVKTSDVLKLNVTGREGEKLGVVREAFVDLTSGRVEFLIIEANSLLGWASSILCLGLLFDLTSWTMPSRRR